MLKIFFLSYFSFLIISLNILYASEIPCDSTTLVRREECETNLKEFLQSAPNGLFPSFKSLRQFCKNFTWDEMEWRLKSFVETHIYETDYKRAPGRCVYK